MGVIGRDLLLSDRAQKVPIERVPVPELGDGEVAIIRGMTGGERDAYQKSILNQRGKRSTVEFDDITAKLVARCLVNEDGTRVFQDEEIPLVSRIRGDVLNRLYTVAQKLSGLTDEDIEELGNGSRTPSGTNSSSSSLSK